MAPERKSRRTGGGGGRGGLSPEEVDSILKDFDRQVEKRKADRDRAAAEFSEKMRQTGKMFLQKLPRADRELKASDILLGVKDMADGEGGGGGGAKEGEVEEEGLEDDLANLTLDARIQGVKDEVRRGISKDKGKAKRKVVGNAAAGDDDDDADYEDYEDTVVKKTSATARKKAAATLAVRKSTRIAENNMFTPAAATFAATAGKRKAGGGGGGAVTPMITPKFDVTRPLPRTQMREAKPKETLVSLSGSPVCVSVRPSAASAVKMGTKKGYGFETLQISLGGGKTVVAPLVRDPRLLAGLSLDEDSREKLTAIKTTLDDLLMNQQR